MPPKNGVAASGYAFTKLERYSLPENDGKNPEQIVRKSDCTLTLNQSFLFYSLTEVSSKGSHFAIKEGVHRNTHKAWTESVVSRPPSTPAVRNFALKIRVWQKHKAIYTEEKICNGKTKGLALLSLNRLIKANQRIEPMPRSKES